MKTLAKSKKPARGAKLASPTKRPSNVNKLPGFMGISPLTGLPFAKARAGVTPPTSADIRAMLANFP